MHLDELHTRDLLRESPPPIEEELLYLHCSLASSRTRDGRERIIHLLHYLECFPLGAHNRAVAQKIEDLLYSDEALGAARAELFRRFRSLRNSHLPPIAERIDFG